MTPTPPAEGTTGHPPPHEWTAAGKRLIEKHAAMYPGDDHALLRVGMEMNVTAIEREAAARAVRAEGPEGAESVMDRRARRAAAYSRVEFQRRLTDVLAYGAEPPEYPGLVLVPAAALAALRAALAEGVGSDGG